AKVDIFPELVLHAPTATSSEDDCVDLVVVQDAPVAEVARSDGRPYPDNHCRFRMKHHVRAFIDPYLLFQQGAIPRPGSMPDEGRIGYSRHDNSHVDASFRGSAQLVDKAARRGEVRLCDPHAPSR